MAKAASQAILTTAITSWNGVYFVAAASHNRAV